MDDIMNFICYLIDNCEGSEVTEESLQLWLSDFIHSDNYNKNKIGRE